MKLGCCAWAFSPRFQHSAEKGIQILGDMGFQGVELIIYQKKDLEEYYTPSKVKELRAAYQSYGMELSQFNIFTPAVERLASMDPLEREEAFDLFKSSTLLAKELGAKAVNMVTNWPYGIKCPHDYPPAYYTPWAARSKSVQAKLHMELPDIDYTQLWNTYMKTMRECLAFVVENGMEFYVEGHALVMVGNTDAMLRMFDWIDSDALGVNFEASWHMIMREYLPLSIRKLGKKIRHLHLRDCDGIANYGLPIGAGIIHWQSVFEALHDVAFDGYASLELGGDPPEPYILASKRYLEKVFAELGI